MKTIDFGLLPDKAWMDMKRLSLLFPNVKIVFTCSTAQHGLEYTLAQHGVVYTLYGKKRTEYLNGQIVNMDYF